MAVSMAANVASGEAAYTPNLASRRAGATNANGELGNGTTSGSTTPVTVLGGLSFATVSPDTMTRAASRRLGRLTAGATPLAVLGGLSFAAVSAGVKSEISAIGKEGKIHGTVVRGQPVVDYY